MSSLFSFFLREKRKCGCRRKTMFHLKLTHFPAFSFSSFVSIVLFSVILLLSSSFPFFSFPHFPYSSFLLYSLPLSLSMHQSCLYIHENFMESALCWQILTFIFHELSVRFSFRASCIYSWTLRVIHGRERMFFERNIFIVSIFIAYF